MSRPSRSGDADRTAESHARAVTAERPEAMTATLKDDRQDGTSTTTAPPTSAGGRRRRAQLRRLATRWHYGFAGLVGATVLFCLSLTPSLLPRGHVLQGLVSGVLAAIGYGLGVLTVWVARHMSTRPLPEVPRAAWRWLAGIAAVSIALFLYLGSAWQHDIHELIGMDPPPRFGFPIVLIVATLTATGLIGAVRLLRRAAHHVSALLGRWIPAATARVVAGLLVVVLVIGVFNGVVLNGLFAMADSTFRTVNDETQPDVEPPADPLRSGGPASLMWWDSLGNQGRTFIAGGPDPARLRGFAGADVQSPIRVYAGLASAPTSRERAALAVQELQRTGAFSRRVLCVITTTGTGWVNARAVDPLEYMYAGDTALVAMQYSYLPSVISFLVDRERARQAGRDLFNQVYGVWSRMPRDQRPRLLVFGESLGSFGAESAFSGTDDIRNRTDGMLLVGPPSRNGLWSELVADRDPGSPAVLPSYEQGATIQFAANAADLRSGASERPRVVYLQYPSDPITWWSPALIVRRPDWLAEPRGADVLPSMQWYPFVTFSQVTADMAISNAVPAGHGHNFGATPVAAWAHLAPPDGWTDERTAALTAIIAADGD
jgi:uncharacterized membrane protein